MTNLKRFAGTVLTAALLAGFLAPAASRGADSPGMPAGWFQAAEVTSFFGYILDITGLSEDPALQYIIDCFSALIPPDTPAERPHYPYPAHDWNSWGLGSAETEYVNNDPDYSWYINQYDTGKYGFENCGPTCATMACKWSDPSFSATAEEARAAYHPHGGWWYIGDISNYLALNDIPCHEVANRGNEKMLWELREGNILIINIDLRSLSYTRNSSLHIDKFYSGGTGHFIILKGFAVVDGRLFYECYDPNTHNYYYPDGQPMGKDRYYDGDEIQAAMRTWYNSYLVIEPRQ